MPALAILGRNSLGKAIDDQDYMDLAGALRMPNGNAPCSMLYCADQGIDDL